MKAIKTKKATMYRQGDQWIVSQWSDHYQAWVLSNPMDYWAAKAAVGTANCRQPDNCDMPSHNHDVY